MEPIPCTSKSLTETKTQYDQIKKRSFATALACKCFIDYTMEKHIKCKQITKTAATTQHEAAGLSSTRLLSFSLCLMRFAYSSHVIGKELYTHLMPSSGPIAIQSRQWAPCPQQGESHFYCQPLFTNQCWKFEAIPSGTEGLLVLTKITASDQFRPCWLNDLSPLSWAYHVWQHLDVPELHRTVHSTPVTKSQTI